LRRSIAGVSRLRQIGGRVTLKVPVWESGEAHLAIDDEFRTDPESAIPELVRLALEVASHAYAPYSGFRVGSALLLSNGEIVTGTNVENVSYGLTLCAERSALVQAVARFGPEIRVVAAAVVNRNDSPSPPCGACRQVLAEFTEPDAPVSFPAGRSGMVAAIVLPFHHLLPFGFDLKLK